MAPGAFMLWLAAATFVIVLLAPGMARADAGGRVRDRSVVAILVWQRWFRGRGRGSDQPALNKAHRRAGRARGAAGNAPSSMVHGRVQIADAFWK